MPKKPDHHTLDQLCNDVAIEHLQGTELFRKIERAVREDGQVIVQRFGTFYLRKCKATTRTLGGVTYDVPAREVVALRGWFPRGASPVRFDGSGSVTVLPLRFIRVGVDIEQRWDPSGRVTQDRLVSRSARDVVQLGDIPSRDFGEFLALRDAKWRADTSSGGLIQSNGQPFRFVIRRGIVAPLSLATPIPPDDIDVSDAVLGGGEIDLNPFISNGRLFVTMRRTPFSDTQYPRVTFAFSFDGLPNGDGV